MRYTFWKPGFILFITVLAGVSQLALPALRPAAAFVFLLICPGAALLGFLNLENRVTELILSVALSLVLVTLTAEVTVLLGVWSLAANIWFLLLLSLLGSTLRIWQVCDQLQATPVVND